MRLFRWGTKKEEDPELTKLREAERKAQELKSRGERVAAAIQGRLERNHWGETIRDIAWRED